MADTLLQDDVIEKVNMDGVPEQLVFGLDIGTRSIVGTVGYKNDTNGFIVVAQTSLEHQTRAMLDGQIHDINMVASTIKEIHRRLEEMTGRTLKDVCIAAAGRVLKTVETEAVMEFPAETVVTNEDIYNLEMLGIENAYQVLRDEKKTDDIRFYCVGYSVKRYYQNGYSISNLEGHKCNEIKAEIITTFLPDEVVDGLYAAVERADLYVANLTLEPIAAINVAIPERFRLLNIALVDVGAGTSDISITKDGSIIAYGMIPSAGDEFTECIARHYLTDFNEADKLKCASTEKKQAEFVDIMGISHTVDSDEVSEIIRETVETTTKSIADKIIELNGGKAVSAVFVVGGGGKVTGFIESLAEYLGLAKERVALRGAEVLGNIKFMQDNINIDSLIVTPVGICLNYYEQRNNFIFVNVNGERIKLYDNSRLTITDAAIQFGLPNEDLFPKRGKTLIYYVNGEKRMVRGEAGEAAVVKLNGKEVGMSTPIEQNAKIDIFPSTMGKDASMEIGKIPEFKSEMVINFNGKELRCPRFVRANGEFVSEYYSIREEDKIEILDYYTLEQVLEFLDIIYRGRIYVNNVAAKSDTKIYDNFSVACEILKEEPNYYELMEEYGDIQLPDADDMLEADDEYIKASEEKGAKEQSDSHIKEENKPDNTEENSDKSDMAESKEEEKPKSAVSSITVNVNGDPVILSGKASYILVDVLDFYPIDTAVAHGDHLETVVNGEICDFIHPVNEGDIIRIEWV